MRLRPRLISYLQRRMPFEPDSVDDLIDGIAVELLERFKERERFPETWFETGAPPLTDQMAFQGLVRRIAIRRFQDRLRARYRRMRWVEQTGDISEQSAPGPESGYEARRLIKALQQRLDEFSPEERELLLQEVGETHQEHPRTGKERVRLYRLRRRLAQLLEEDLKQ